MLHARCTSRDGAHLSVNEILLAPPDALFLPAARVEANVTAAGLIKVSTNATALFVLLTTRANGRFGDNLFLLTPSTSRRLRFFPFGDLDIELLRATLRVEHLQQRLAG